MSESTKKIQCLYNTTMKIKDFKNLLEQYHRMIGLTPTISKARLNNKCDGCGGNISSGSFYISMSYYANLWYRFHFATRCRAKAIVARETLEDHTELIIMKDSELADWLDFEKPNKVSDEIAQEFGFKSIANAREEVLKLKPLRRTDRWFFSR